MSVQTLPSEKASTAGAAVNPLPGAMERAAQVGERILRETMTPLLLLDLIARGELGLVERVLAAITNFDQRTVNALLFDRGWIGLRTLYRAAGFELRHLHAIGVALDALKERGGGVEHWERTRHAERCLSRFLTGAEHLPRGDVDEVLSLLEETPRVSQARTL